MGCVVLASSSQLFVHHAFNQRFRHTVQQGMYITLAWATTTQNTISYTRQKNSHSYTQLHTATQRHFRRKSEPSRRHTKCPTKSQRVSKALGLRRPAGGLKDEGRANEESTGSRGTAAGGRGTEKKGKYK